MELILTNAEVNDILKEHVLKKYNMKVIETRGGFHLLINSNDVDSYASTWRKDWYKTLKDTSDVVGDCLTPLPGCWQGGFIPKLKNI